MHNLKYHFFIYKILFVQDKIIFFHVVFKKKKKIIILKRSNLFLKIQKWHFNYYLAKRL